ncbi:MAG TPA: hypothetical protein VMS11_12045 [Solirubrobacterales bacterium]|nr:hypothetical protein [Solirubrobacterales bacterium]
MERSVWTDERLDDLARKVDAGFERVDRDIRDLRMLMFQLWGATMLGIFATIGTVIATNA